MFFAVYCFIFSANKVAGEEAEIAKEDGEVDRVYCEDCLGTDEGGKVKEEDGDADAEHEEEEFVQCVFGSVHGWVLLREAFEDNVYIFCTAHIKKF